MRKVFLSVIFILGAWFTNAQDVVNAAEKF